MLSNTLVTNEIKNAAAAEVEFSRIGSQARETTFAQASETPSLPHRLNIKHQETGSGVTMRRRSLVRFDKSVTGQVDTTKVERISGYIVMDLPVGNLTTMTEPQNVLAETISFCASTGASTTILYDCTGNGAKCLINGEL